MHKTCIYKKILNPRRNFEKLNKENYASLVTKSLNKAVNLETLPVESGEMEFFHISINNVANLLDLKIVIHISNINLGGIMSVQKK